MNIFLSDDAVRLRLLLLFAAECLGCTFESMPFIGQCKCKRAQIEEMPAKFETRLRFAGFRIVGNEVCSIWNPARSKTFKGSFAVDMLNAYPRSIRIRNLLAEI